ncbi:MAG TPA: hypothetical protein VFV50_18605, partial [Bdellovibrionales bacterium]|nr:hypothetical protein [Bdellovibrionales bacterium]
MYIKKMHLGLKRRCLAIMLFWAFVMPPAPVHSASVVAQAETPEDELVPEISDDVVAEEAEPEAAVEDETKAAEAETEQSAEADAAAAP